jgi:hypothetical protein
VLTLAGTVEGDLQVIPKRLVFDRVVAGSSAEVAEEVTITTKTAADAQNLTVRSPSEQVIIRPLGGGETYRKFAVSLAKDVPPGEVRERLLVTIPGTLEAPVNLPVFASVVPPVKVSPTTLSFGVIDGKSPLTRSVRIDNLNDEPLVIDGVESTHEAVTATIHERVNGKRYTLKVVIDPHKVTSNVEATLNIRASGSRDPLAIKVLGETPPRNY